jgi:hypothetical protein
VDDEERLLDRVESAVRLEAGRIRGCISKKVTSALTDAIGRTLARQGLIVQFEYPVRFGKYWRYIDVVGISPDSGLLHTAVEIDIYFNERSVRKLSHVIEGGALGIWPRWGVIKPWERSRVPTTFRHMEVPLEYRSFNDPIVQRRRELANAAEAALGGPLRQPTEPWEQSWSKTLASLGV